MPLNDDNSQRELARQRLEARLERSSGAARTQEGGSGRGLPRISSAASPALNPAAVATGMLETYGLRFIAVVGIIALLLVSFLAGTVLRSCAGESQHASSSSAAGIVGQGSSAAAQASSEGAAPSANSSAEGAAAKKEALREILEDDLVDSLLRQSRTSKDLAWISVHPEAYESEGWEVQHKILKLAIEEPLAVDYVRSWPNSYPAEDQSHDADDALPEKKTGARNIPLLMQWDKRWAYTVYSSTTFGLTGCCPTTLAMVYQGLTGKTDKTPYDMGLLAQEHGYMATYEGTDAYFLVNEAPGLGLSCSELWPSAENLVSALQSNRVVIANVGPGDFTDDGHFIVCTGLEDGKVLVNDPYSRVRSDKLWDPEEIAQQSKTYFSFSAA